MAYFSVVFVDIREFVLKQRDRNIISKRFLQLLNRILLIELSNIYYIVYITHNIVYTGSITFYYYVTKFLHSFLLLSLAFAKTASSWWYSQVVYQISFNNSNLLNFFVAKIIPILNRIHFVKWYPCGLWITLGNGNYNRHNSESWLQDN